MSIAITVGGTYLGGREDYQPASKLGRNIPRMWDPRGSATDWAPVIEAALLGIGKECGRVGWDGDESLPVSDQTIRLVEQVTACLFTLLPRGTPAPDLIPEADGEICMSWSIDADRLFSASVGAHGKINFAGQFSTGGEVHAWQPIDRKSRASLEKSLQDVVRYVGKLFEPPADRRAV